MPLRLTDADLRSVQKAQRVTVEVFDLLARRVARLHDGPLAAGETTAHTLPGTHLASGLYFTSCASRASGSRRLPA